MNSAVDDRERRNVPSIAGLEKLFLSNHAAPKLRRLAVIARDLDTDTPTVPPLPFRVANGKIVGRDLMNVLVDKSAIAARHERD